MHDPAVVGASSIAPLSLSIQAANTRLEFRAVAADIRRTAARLLDEGLQAHALTAIISQLNDALTQRLVHVTAHAHGRDLNQACWLAFGSEGRSEQTVATDQDNGLIFVGDDPGKDRVAWLSFAHDVNEALDDCGFPLCKGDVMARNPACCLTPAEWQTRLATWIEQGTPQDLLAAAIYFDLRPVAGRCELTQPLRAQITVQAQANPRFCRQLAEQVLGMSPGLDWRGAIRTESVDGVPLFDLKRHGTTVFVAVARLRSLALGIAELNTRRRLEAFARLSGVAQHEAHAWVTAFEFVQTLRLRTQIRALDTPAFAAHPNHIRLDALDDLEMHILKETLHVARRLQQAVELDYHRG